MTLPASAENPPIEFSVIICSIDQAKYAAVVESYRRAFGDATWELIGIHDAKSLAEAYNRGLRAARGKYLVLSHDDVELLNEDLAAVLRANLGQFDLMGIAGTTRLTGDRWDAAGDPYIFTMVTYGAVAGNGWETILIGGGEVCQAGMQAVDGVFMAVTREVASALAFDEAGFDGFHLYDIDFSFRAYRAGYRVAVCRNVVLIHASRGNYDAVWSRYQERFNEKHRGLLALPTEPHLGARAYFRTASKEEIRRLCQPLRIRQIAGQIDANNRDLVPASPF